MSITTLTTDTLIQLYPNQLVVVEAEATPTKKAEPVIKEAIETPLVEIKPTPTEPTKSSVIPAYLGGFQKKILLLHRQNNTKHISDETLQLVTGILNACKLNLQDVAIMNLNEQELHYQVIMDALQPTHIFSFGIEPLGLQLPFQIPNYQTQSYLNATFLFAVPFDTMLPQVPKSKEEKTKLWNCLKKIFQL